MLPAAAVHAIFMHEASTPEFASSSTMCSVPEEITAPALQAASEYLTFQRVAVCEYSFPAETKLSPDAEDLIRQLLVLEPFQRLGERCLHKSLGVWSPTRPSRIGRHC